MAATSAASVDPSTQMVPNQLASLVPTYDPSKDDLQVYCQKVELLCSTWPESKFGELATRLILGCQGTAFVKLQLCKDEVTKNERKSIQRIIELLGGQWGQIPLEKKFEAAERALYRCSQRSDETNDSYLARADVLWQEWTSKNMRLEELQAYIVLRGSNLGPEDKKKVLINSDAQTSGKLSMKEVSSAIRFLGAGFFHEVTTGKKGTKLRTYDSTALIAEEAEFDEGQTFMAEDDALLEDEYVDAMIADGDDDALLVSEFETAASEVIQEDVELASAYSAYTDARKRLAEKFRHRGFFPSSHGSGKGKARFGKSGSKGKLNRSWGGQRKNLQNRILNSNCRLCGKRGHWKAECPNRGSETSGAGQAGSNAGSNFTGLAVTEIPDGLPLEFLDLQEFGNQVLDDSFLHEGVVFHVDIESMDAKDKLRKTLKRIQNFHMHGDNAVSHHRALANQLRIRNKSRSLVREHSHGDVRSPDILSAVVPPKTGILPHVETAWMAHDLSMKAEGVLDSGATKTVIGSQLIGELLKALHPEVKNKVYRSSCEVTFRFGNLNTLEARQALVVPCGPVNLHIAIVPGSTPFLISNTLMRALKAIVNTNTQEMHSPCFQYPIKLRLSPRGLFMLDINELVKASAMSSEKPKCQDTFVAEAEKQLTPAPTKCNRDIQEANVETESHENQNMNVSSQNNPNFEKSNWVMQDATDNHRIKISTMNKDSEIRDDAFVCEKSSITNDPTNDNLASQDRNRDLSVNPSDREVPPEHHGQQRFGAAPPATSCSSGRSTSRGPVEVQHRTAAEHGVGLWEHSQRKDLWHHVAGSTELGQMVSPTLWQQQEGCSPSHSILLSAGDRKVRTGGRSDSTDGCPRKSTTSGDTGPKGQSQGSSQDPDPSSCGAEGTKPRHAIGYGSSDRGILMGACGSQCGRGLCECGRSQLCRSDCRDQCSDGKDECHRKHAEPGCRPSAEQSSPSREVNLNFDCLNLHAGDIDWDPNDELCHHTQDLGSNSDQQYFRRLIQQYTQELQSHSTVERNNRDGHVLFEVFCGPTSQLTQQCQNLSRQAQRFSRNRCDLQSREGRSILFEELHKCCPEHIWFAPECKPWCAFSNLNGSQSLEKWEELQQNRRRHLAQVALGIVLYRYQQSNDNHLHWEQPRSSLMFKLPVLKELYEGTFAAEFDMCQFGLIDPTNQSPIKKGMTVMTTSKTMYNFLHGKTCQGRHNHHQRIEGSMKVADERIPRSQFTENYPRKFARSIAMQLVKTPRGDRVKELCLVSLARSSAEPIDNRLVKKPRLSLFRAKSEASRVSEPSTSEPAKRRRMENKQTQVTVDQAWKSILDNCSPFVKRVGKQVIEDPKIINEIQDLIADKRVCFLVAGRGIDRTMPPCKDVVSGEAPFRKSVFIHRVNGKILIEDEWENWENLSRRQLVRGSHPCKFCITIFARNPHEDASVPLEQASKPDATVTAGMDNSRKLMPVMTNPKDDNSLPDSEPMELGPVQRIDAVSTAHGPKFSCLSKEHQQAVIKAHTNLGHPSSERLKMLFRQQGIDASIIDGVDDLRCSTCAIQSRPKVSRTATIRNAIDFNDRIAVDGLKFTNQQGQVFHLYHIVDIGTSFHTAIIAPSRTSDNAIQCLIQAWLCWAGAPVELVIDSASELNSETFMGFLQQYNIRCITTVPDAHWQNGRAERHGAILEDMLKKIDQEYPINSYSQLQRCLWHATQAKNASSLRRGFSPEILVFGKGTRLPGSLCGDDQLPSHGLAESETSQGIQFKENLALRESARKAFHAADNSSALRRAMLSRTRPSRGQYVPGEWIMLWKTMGNQKGWFGPMQVVIHENENIIWLTWCGKLYRGAPENVRPVSAYEAKKIDFKTASNENQIVAAQDQIRDDHTVVPTETTVIPEHVTRVPMENTEVHQNIENNEPVNPSVGSQSQPDLEPETESVIVPGEISNQGLNPVEVPIPSYDEGLHCIGLESIDEETAFFIEEDMKDLAWRIEINIGDEDITSWRNEKDPHEMCFLASAAKRSRAEVKLVSLNSQEKAEFQKAKKSEIMNWLRTDTVCKMLRNQLSPQEVLRCRWVLTWKPIEEQDRDPKDSKDKKAKARLVVLGYLDPSIEKLNRDSPTLSKHARMLLLQLIASNNWTLRSFDIKAAFLQGKTQEDRVIGIEPVPELIEAMHLQSNEICRLKKSAYGLIDAPYLWYQTLNEELVKLGFESSPFDPCLYILRKEDGTPRGALGIHVDDGLCGGDKVFQSVLEKLQQKYPFGSQKISDFVFTGIHLRQRSDMGIVLSQSDYVRKITPIKIDCNRKSQIQEKVNADERQQLRALIGSLQYASVNTRPDIASRLSFLQSKVNCAVVETLLEANRTLHEAKRHHDVELVIQPIACPDLRFLAFSDASFASKSTPDSHTGCLIMSTHKDIMDNAQCPVSPLSWGCKKIQRVVTSTLSAETMSLATTLDQLSWIKLFWGWMLNPNIKWRKPTEALRDLPEAISTATYQSQKLDPSIAATDCKSLFDLVTRTAPPNCGEFRTQLQARSIKDLLAEGIKLRWVHSGAQLADALTKIMEASFLRETLRLGKYKLHDELAILKQRSHNRTRLKWLKDQKEYPTNEEDCYCLECFRSLDL